MKILPRGVNLELVAWIAGALVVGYVIAKRKSAGCGCAGSSSSSSPVYVQT